MLRLPYIYIALSILCINFNLSAQIITSSILTSRPGAQADAPVIYTSYGIMDGTHTQSTALAHREGIGHRFSFYNPLSAKYRPFDRPVAPMRSGENDKNQETKAYLDFDIGIMATYLASSKRLRTGYSGLGFTLNVHLFKFLGWIYKRNYWYIEAIDPANPYTPFQSFQTPMNIFMLRLSAHLGELSPFFQLGVGGANKRIGGRKWGGIISGIGCRIPLSRTIYVSFVFERKDFGNYGVSGDVYDSNKEICIEIIHAMQLKDSSNN